MEVRKSFESIVFTFTVDELELVARYLRFSSYYDYLDLQRLQASGASRGEKMAVRSHMDVTNHLASEIELYVSSLSEEKNHKGV